MTMTSPYSNYSSISLSSASPTSPSLLQPVYRRFQSSVSCDNSIYGCPKRFMTSDESRQHHTYCQYSPTSTIECPDCHKQVSRLNLRRHNCIRELSSTINELKEIIATIEVRINEQMVHLNECRHILEASPNLFLNNDSVDSSRRNSHPKEVIEPKEEVFESQPVIDHKEEKIERKKSVISLVRSPSDTYQRTSISKQISSDGSHRMYGSLKHKFLAKMLSQDFCDSVPPIDYQLDELLENDLKKKNTAELIDVNKDNNSSSGKTPLVRIRSWSERH